MTPEILEGENSLQMRQIFDSRMEKNTDKTKNENVSVPFCP
jgi:hypothetical protein